MIRRRISASMAVSMLALFVALSGTAVAASRYIITSSNQIKPGAIGNEAPFAMNSAPGGELGSDRRPFSSFLTYAPGLTSGVDHRLSR